MNDDESHLATTGEVSGPALDLSVARLRRDLRLFHVYRFLSTSYLFVPVLIAFFRARGLDFLHIGLLNSVYALTAICFEVPTGALADRFGRRRAMMLGALLMAAGCLVNFQGATFWWFALGEGLLALGMTLTSGADSAYLYDRLAQAGRSEDYRRYEGSATASKLLGASLALVAGGYLAERSLELTYGVSAIVCALAAIVAAMMHERPLVERRRMSRGIWSGFGHGIVRAGSVVFAQPELRLAVIFSLLAFTLLRAGLYLHPAYLSSVGFTHAGVGWVMAGLSLVGAVGAFGVEPVRRRIGEAGLVWGLPMVLGLTYACLTSTVALVGVGLLVLQAWCNGIYSPLSKELLNREIHESRQRATVLSVESMFRRLAFGVFAPVAGWLLDSHGLVGARLLCFGFAIVGALVLGSALRRRGAAGPVGVPTAALDLPRSGPRPVGAPQKTAA